MSKFPVGYQALIEQFKLTCMPHYRSSYIVHRGAQKITLDNHNEIHEYPKGYEPHNPQDPFEQLEFALKYDGINLDILACFFQSIDQQALCQWIQQRPTSKYTRKAWFLFEMLTGESLALPDIQAPYINLLDPKHYYTATAIKSKRHAINNNLLGNTAFCPMIRRTATLEKYINKTLDLKAQAIVKNYEPSILERANTYLLTKETMSSYEIERERPDKKRISRFIHLLQRASSIEHLTKEILIESQQTIMDPRFKEFDYRHTQNYVGENINQYRQKIHFISPKPSDLPDLMQGLLDSLTRMEKSDFHPVLMAATIAFGFVFLHPFEDGNGRIHRFLIHYILSKHHFTPQNIVFPISAIILQHIREYDSILESYSKPLLDVVSNFHLDNDGILAIHQETKQFYQSIDFTHISEYLFSCIEDTIETHFKKELDFLVHYDQTKHLIQSVVDMPDNLIDLFIRCLLQNNGKLSSKKQQKYFHALTKDELDTLTDIVTSHML